MKASLSVNFERFTSEGLSYNPGNVKLCESPWIFEIVKSGFQDPCWNGCRRASERATARQKCCTRGKSGGAKNRNMLYTRGKAELGVCSEKRKERGEIEGQPED